MDINRQNIIYNDFSDDEDDEDKNSEKSTKKQKSTDDNLNCDKRQNIILKILNRERMGYFSSSYKKKRREPAFNKVPSYLTFCLKNIVPFCYLQGHVFMGLTACGQFLLSYKVSYNDESITNVYNFSTGYNYKYELYFWIYRPHMLLGKYYKVCLFDDHGVDNLKTVTMSQWLNKTRTLIVHGASEYENEDSYITIVAVPKLGCLDCKKFRDESSETNFRCDALCIKCNLTIHTKYNRSDSDPKFNPKIYLSCPDYIIMIANGFIHMINVELDVPRIHLQQQSTTTLLSSIKSPLHNTSIDLQFLSNNKTLNGDLFECEFNNKQQNDMTQITAQPSSITNSNNYVQHKKNSHIEQHYDKRMFNYIGYDEQRSLSNNLIDEYGSCNHTNPNGNGNNVSGGNNNKSIVDRIIADFAECETDNTTLEKTVLFSRMDKQILNNVNNFGELIITCNSSHVVSSQNGISGGNINNKNNSDNNIITDIKQVEKPKTPGDDNVRLLKYQNIRNNCNLRNIRTTTNNNNCITKVELNSTSLPPPTLSTPSTSSSPAIPSTSKFSQTNKNNNNNNNLQKQTNNLDIAEKTYEFSEDNEKCEKISIFRKRRLADKKYEFSEDNSENIIPFNKIRSMYKNLPIRTKIRNSLSSSISPSHNLINGLFSPAPPNYDHITSHLHLHRASPNHGFRSPCGSPVGNRCLRSPPGFSKYARSPTYAMRSPNTLSPRQHIQQQQQQPKKYDDIDNNLIKFISGNSPINSIQMLNDIKHRNETIVVTNTSDVSGNSTPDKPICSKRFVRRFVEEDDATSVITSEEDDCISPGYHTSLPMEVHGSGYSDMQMISRVSYNKLKCPTVIITQHSFDLETFTFHIANHLCTINNKKYGIFYDWACELIDICPVSCILSLLLMVHFTARDQLLPNESKKCHNCSSNLDCVIHRKMYQCRTFFTWNIENGDWNILDYGDLIEVTEKNNKLNIIAKKIANDISCNYQNNHNLFNNLWILDSKIEKSKDTLKDLQNSIEFYRLSDNDSEFSDLNNDTDDDDL